MTQFPKDLLEEAKRIFEPQYGHALTDEDAREILENLVGYFDILIEWDAKRRKERSEADSSSAM